MNQLFTFNDILSEIKKFMILEDNNDYIIDVLLATSLSIELSRPIWIMITAPPSSGKTELLNLLSKTENFHKLHNLTPKFLFSGYTAAQGGYVPREIKDKGVIAFPDFTTVLSLNSKARNEIFNQLRVMYDGEAGLGTGMDLGQYKSWKGNVAVIGLVTEAIEKIKEKTSDLGERFLYYYYYPKELTNEELRSFILDEDVKKKMPLIIKNYLISKKGELESIQIPEDDMNRIISFSKFIAIGRAPVERTGYSREIDHVLSPEKPHRLIEALSSFYKSLLCVNGDKTRTLNIIKYITFSSIPNIRKEIIFKIANSKEGSLRIVDIADGYIKCSVSKIRRTVEDLVVQEILNEKASENSNLNFYSFTEIFKDLFSVLLSD